MSHSPSIAITLPWALLEGAELAPDAEIATYLRETADAWNDSVERWTYVTGTKLANKVGVEGYYVRIAHTQEMARRRSRAKSK